MNYLFSYSCCKRMNLKTALNTFKKQKQKHSLIILKQSFIPLYHQLQEEWERIVVNKEEFFITEAFFHDLKSNPDEAGAICSTIANSKLCIEKSTFDNCSSPKYGGAIYMYTLTEDTSFNMSFVCGTHCKCNGPSFNSGQFCYISLGSYQNSLKFSNIFESSILYNKNTGGSSNNLIYYILWRSKSAKYQCIK